MVFSLAFELSAQAEIIKWVMTQLTHESASVLSSVRPSILQSVRPSVRPSFRKQWWHKMYPLELQSSFMVDVILGPKESDDLRIRSM